MKKKRFVCALHVCLGGCSLSVGCVRVDVSVDGRKFWEVAELRNKSQHTHKYFFFRRMFRKKTIMPPKGKKTTTCNLDEAKREKLKMLCNNKRQYS